MTSLQHTLKQADISVDANLLAQLTSLVDELQISADDFVNEWQSYSMNNDSNKTIDVSSINPSSFPHFSNQLRVSKTAKMAKKSRARSSTKKTPSSTNGFMMHNAQTIGAVVENMSTPIAARSKRHAASTTRVHHMQARTQDPHNDEVATWLNMSTPAKPGSAVHSSQFAAAAAANSCTPNHRMPTIATQSPIPYARAATNETPAQQHQSQKIPLHMLQSPAAPMSAYKSGKRKGQVVCAFNADKIAIGHRCARARVEEVGLTAAGNNHDDGHHDRFMYEDVHHKQDAIKLRLRHIGQRLMHTIIAMENDKNNENENDVKTLKKTTTKGGDGGAGDSMDVEDQKHDKENELETFFSNVQEPSQCARYYLGRIMNDGDNAGSDKITAGNMVLEGDPFVSYGSRVRVDISGLSDVGVALFPGQMVALRGLNSSGKEIFVERIYADASSSSCTNRRCRKKNGGEEEEEDEGTLRVMMACGPFTPKNSVDFEGSPLSDFGAQITRQEPNVVVVTGPFTDADNELIRKNNVSATFQEIFEHLLSAFVAMIASSCDEIVVVPSTKDVHHFSAFPQESYLLTSNTRLPTKVRFLRNPTQFRINNVVFGISSADFLFDCCRMGLMRNLQDRLLAMMSHCLQQQSFYPLQPSTPALRLDHDKYERLFMSQQLDVFVMPSTLKQFAKLHAATNTVCVNPSFLTKLNSGGTYAMLYVQKSNDARVDDYSKLIRVDVLKI